MSEDYPANEEVCVPNGFALCSTHPVCDYMRGVVREYQTEVARLKANSGRIEILEEQLAVATNRAQAWRHLALQLLGNSRALTEAMNNVRVSVPDCIADEVRAFDKQGE